MTRFVLYLGLVALLAGCQGSEPATPLAATDGGVSDRKPFTLAEAKDPTQCKQCHPSHYQEWASSMHAYASQDPVFIAMNKRGQRETNGALGDFCIKCHSPMAVRDKKVVDGGANLGELSAAYQGVTCYSCHNADGVEADPDRPDLDAEHNAKLHLTNDVTMRGGIQNPIQPGKHRAAYSEYFERKNAKSALMCGGCHDIVTLAGVHLERTLEEYKSSVFAVPNSPTKPAGFDTCIGCHMDPREDIAAVDPPSHVVSRTVHEHMWPGVDVPLTDFPDRAAMRSAVEDCVLGQTIAYFTVDFSLPDTFLVTAESNAGHNQPSGAAQDRRMWLEFVATDAQGKEILRSGTIADDEIEDKPMDDLKRDPHLWMLRDRIYDGGGQPVDMFWQTNSSSAFPSGYDGSATLPVATAKNFAPGTHSKQRSYSAFQPAKVNVQMHMRPIGMDVLQDLVASGDLDPAVVSQMPTFTLTDSVTEWTAGQQTALPSGPPNDCKTYKCMMHPGSAACDAN